MKRIIPIVFFFALIVTPAPAQMYIRLGGGYGLGLGSQYITAIDNWPYHQEMTSVGVYGSYGKGFEIGGAFGIQLSDNIMIELGGRYNAGSTYEGLQQHFLLGYVRYYQEKYSGHMISLEPSVIIKGNSKAIVPYARLGVIAAFPKVSGKYDTDTLHTSPNVFALNSEYSGPMAWGFTGGAGLMFPAGNETSFFAEIEFTSLEWSPSKLFQTFPADHVISRTDFTDNGGSIYGNGAFRKSLPFSSIGVNVGMVYTLN
jgi:hypothetical protein